MTAGVSIGWPALQARSERQLSGQEMSILFGGAEDDGTAGPAQAGKCCYVIAECAANKTNNCKDKEFCDGDGLDSIATYYAKKCGKTPPGPGNPNWACANHESALGNPAICAVRKQCVKNLAQECVYGATVQGSEVTGQWFCEQSSSCQLIPAPPPEDPPPGDDPTPIDPPPID